MMVIYRLWSHEIVVERSGIFSYRITGGIFFAYPPVSSTMLDGTISRNGGFTAIRSVFPTSYEIWLVVWNMTGLWLSIQLGMSSSLTNSYFSEGFKPPTSCILLFTIFKQKWYWSHNDVTVDDAGRGNHPKLANDNLVRLTKPWMSIESTILVNI